nr:acyltransferase [Bifidobacterium miconis]
MLRIMAMLLIVSCHFVANMGWDLEDSGPLLSRSAAWAWNHCAGQIGVCLFFLLSGYFQVNKEFHLRKPVSVMVQTFLYTAGILLLQACLLIVHPTDGIRAIFAPAELFRTLYTALLPVFNGTYWFITAYVLMMMVSPYLNMVLHHATRQASLRLIMVLMFVSLMPLVSLAPLFWTTWTYAMAGYLIGGWLRLHGESSRLYRFVNRWTALVAMAVAYLVLVLFIYAALRFGFWDWLRSDSRSVFGVVPAVELVASSMVFVAMMKAPAIDAGRISRYVMPVSGSVFGVYLIHENPYVRANVWTVLTAILPHPNTVLTVVGLMIPTVAGLFAALTMLAFVYDGVIVKPVQRMLGLRS